MKHDHRSLSATPAARVTPVGFALSLRCVMPRDGRRGYGVKNPNFPGIDESPHKTPRVYEGRLWGDFKYIEAGETRFFLVARAFSPTAPAGGPSCMGEFRMRKSTEGVD